MPNFTYDDLPEIKYARLKEWSELGYKVKKGSKAFWIEDEAYFTEAQVEINLRHRPRPQVQERPKPTVPVREVIPF